ncbi:uncharacterized protein LOC101864709 [Aplysia californica]|uniref:Uncharacterized protein LOC101864709 n=1 Tax=Aplysia californica TaxID=6500 RepID=A0ABM0K2C2_APLCA|nr:uncharacterized protein LOC101864709 [Aplysia californica]
MMASVCLKVGLVSSGLGLTCAVMAIASSMWLRIRYPFLKNDIGLMRHCDVDSDYCGDMERLDALVDVRYAAWFRSVQALYLLHCVGLLVSTAMYILYTIRFFESKGSFKVLTAFNFLTVAFGVYAVAVFGTSYSKFFGLGSHPTTDDYSSLDWAFYTAITGCCFSFLVMIFSAMEASQAADIFRNMQHRITVWNTPYTLFVDQETA